MKIIASSNINNFILDLRNLGYPNPLNNKEIIINSVLVKVIPFDGKIVIESIRSLDPNKGNATVVLNLIKQIAIKNNVVLSLSPEPFGESRMSKNKLIEWYSKNGFKSKNKNLTMEFYPS